jgi:hypothetical protein
MSEYQELYRRLFSLAIRLYDEKEDFGRQAEAKELRQQMDKMPPTGRRGDELKEEWGRAVGTKLYFKHVYEIDS